MKTDKERERIRECQKRRTVRKIEKSRLTTAGHYKIDSNPEIKKKIEFAYARGCSKAEVCAFADVHSKTLDEYLKRNPEEAERLEALKSRPLTNARMNVTQAIEEGDVDVSKWYLERKAKDEFSTKANVDITPSATIKDKEEALREFMDNFKFESD